MDGFTKIDLFGDFYTFRINNNTKFKTEVGGFLTLLTMGLFILSIVYLGDNFFYRQNPYSTFETGIYSVKDLPKINYAALNQTNYMFISNIKFLTSFFKLKYKSYSSEGEKKAPLSTITAAQFMNITGMSSNTIRPNFEVVAIDISNFTLGNRNNWEPNYGTLTISLDFCNINGEYFSSVELSSCDQSAIDTIRNNTENMLVDVFVERVGFDKNNYKDPFIKKFKQYTFTIRRDEALSTSFNYKVHRVESDDGWIFPSQTNFTSVGVDSFSYQTLSMNVAKIKRVITDYTIDIKLTDDFVKYTRTYVKFQDFLAGILSIMKVVLIAVDFANLVFRTYKLDMFVADKYFTYITDDDHNIHQADASKNIPTDKKDKAFKVNNFINGSKEKVIELSVKKDLSLNESKESRQEDDSQSNHTDQGLKKHTKIAETPDSAKEKKNFGDNTSFFKYAIASVKNLFTNKKLELNERSIDLKTCLNITNKLMDIDYFFKKLLEMEVLKHMFLNENQIMALSSLKKVEIIQESKEKESTSCFFSDLVKSPEVIQESVVNYFTTKKVEEGFDKNDTFLYSQLEQSIREEIESRVNNQKS